MHIPATVPALLACEVILLLGCFLTSSFLILDVDPETYLLFDNGLRNIGLLVIGVITCMYFQDMYTNIRVRSRTVLVQEISTAFGIAFLMQAAANYTFPNTMVPRWLMLTGSGLSLVTLFVFRGFYSSMIAGQLASTRVLFLGTNDSVRAIARQIQNHPELGMTPVGFVEQPGIETGDLDLVGTVGDLEDAVERTKAEKIIVGLTERRNVLPMHVLLDLKSRGVDVEEARLSYERTHFRVSINDLRPADLMFSDWLRISRTADHWQKIISIFLAMAGFVVTLPLMMLVWLLVKVTSPGPAIYAQTRSGLNGKPFKVFKFRSMRVDAEAATGAVWASRNDPRITPLGVWLRKLRLDELPQFVNVIRGEMNLVGPRPERPEFVRTLQEKIPFYRQRLFVRPGLTGWAQINHKYGDTIEDTVTKLEYDLYYIKHRTISLDLYIMFQTVKVMLLHRGAQ